MISRWKGRARNAAGVLALAVLGLALGCGGGGGAGGIRISGLVTAPIVPTGGSVKRVVTGSALADAQIDAFLVTDLTKSIASARSDAQGRYNLVLPASAAGKDVLLVAQKGSTRVEMLLCDVPGRDVLGADINGATTVTAELVLSTAKSASPPITDIDGASVATILNEIAAWEDIDSVGCAFPGNRDLEDAISGGLKGGTDLYNFVTGNSVIQEALKNLRGSTNADVTRAKQMIQWMRDSAAAFNVTGEDGVKAVQDAMQEQQSVLDNETQVVAAVSNRLDFVSDAIDLLDGYAPGRYDLTGFSWEQ